MKESELRDHLKLNLDLIEDGLELVNAEFYLKNKIGTSGFVDILARDSEGRLVVIEIKISKHSERDAITELFKYIALLKQNMSLKDSEIRLLVISTDWRELLVPFAEFNKSTSYSTCGLRVKVNSNAYPTHIEKIDLPSLSVGRKLIPRHWIQIYKNESGRNSSAIKYSQEITKRGIKNFIIVSFHYDYNGVREYGFYFAQQEEELEVYKTILKSVSEERYTEICDYTDDFTDDEDILNEFADASIDMICVPADHLEIGHPEKIKGYLEKDMWVIDEIMRYGTFSEDIRLTDAQIIDDLCGYSGASYTWYSATVKRSDSAHIKEVSERYSKCLYYNDRWRQAIRDFIDYFLSKGSESTMHLCIFNPENILASLYHLSKYSDLSYLPNFRMIIENPVENKVEIFEGTIISTCKLQKCLDEIVDDHFLGSDHNIVMFEHLHGISEINSEVMSSLSLEYSLRYKLFDTEEENQWLESPVVRGRQITGRGLDIQKLFDWMSENKTIVGEISSVYENLLYNS